MNSTQTNVTRKPAGAPRRQPLWVASAAFLATLLALPVHAGVVIPDEPLTTGIRVAPNILFILDDSGSMAWRNVNNKDVAAITGTGGFNSSPDADGVGDGTDYGSYGANELRAMFMQASSTNTLYYNPSVDYLPWVLPDGSRMTGGTTYTAAYSSNDYVTYDTKSGGTINLNSYTQTVYVPKNPADQSSAYLSNAANYYRYRYLSSGRGIERSEFGKVTGTTVTGLTVTPSSGQVRGTGSENSVTSYTNNVAAWADVQIRITGTAKNGVYTVTDPAGAQVCRGIVASGTTVVCAGESPTAGKYKIVMQPADTGTSTYTKFTLASSTFSGGNACDATASLGGYGWINCTSGITPTGRSWAQEQTNFATWYSYYRTRIKSAKGGAAEAFKPLDRKVRVGYRTIWDRSNLDIPVTLGDGRFFDDSTASIANRSNWYKRLFAAAASNGTPLQTALKNAGAYFSGSSATGPYGPESGSDQLSCRQNFTILTTDGYWNSAIETTAGNADGTNGPTILGPKSTSYTYSAAKPFSDGISKTLADMAMYYWKNDLRTEASMGNSTSPDGNNVPTTSSDPAFWQHMVTFTIALGLETTKGWTSVEDATTAINGGDTWPDPSTGSASPDNPRRLDDLLHAAVNGHGTFVSANSPAAFADALKRALAAIAQRTSSFSNVATNSTSLNTGAQVFAASYTSGIWTGVVKAYPVTYSGGISSTASWTATFPAHGVRKVFTYSGSSGAAFPTSTQLAALTRTGGVADYPVTGTDNANYIRGDGSREDRNGGNLRSRTTVLGDIVNSSPAYEPRGKVVYVGANDGMLHAIDGNTGAELFAYIPGTLTNFTNLASLSRPDYEHKFFVDGPITISPYNSYVPNKSILVGTMGRGGKGLYALDVSTPGSFNTSNVLWERQDTPSTNIGNVVGAPVLGMVRNGTNVPAVVFGNGPNSGSDKAVLVVLNMNDGSVIREIPTDSTTNNGLFAPTGVYAADGKTLVYAYAGDRQGNIWKFDMTSASPSAWTATKIFHAEKIAGTPQPITSAPALAVDIATNKRWVFFGTGSYMSNADANDVSTDGQSMYGFMDDGASYTRSNLTARTITVSGSYRYFEAKSSLPTTSKGWYVDLPGKGERIVQNAQINGTFLVTASMIPVGDACLDASGTGFINALDAFTGTSGGKSMFDLNNDGSTDDTGAGGSPIGSVNTGVGMPTLPVLLPGQIIVGGSGDGSSSGLSGARTFGMSWQRVSWREIRSD